MTKNTLKLDVLRVCQPIGEFFIASVSAQDLLEISFSDVRRLVSEQRDVERYLGIQRPVNSRRIKGIRKYIEGSDATFPTAVIVAIDERCAEFESVAGPTGILTLMPFTPETGSDIAKVLDGQHRIAAFMDEDNEFAYAYEGRVFELNLAIFIGADISEQANIFATVNLAQTKVNRSLVYDLTELAKARSPHRTCHNVAVMLDSEASSPLYQRIKRLGTATPGRKKEPLTQAAFVEALVRFISSDPVSDRNLLLDGKRLIEADDDLLNKCPFRNMFIEKKDLEIAEILFNYFSAVRNKWPKSWADLEASGNLLPKSNAFKALMKFLRDDVYCDIVGTNFGEIPTSTQFGKHFKAVQLGDTDFTAQNFLPGSGGQSMFLKMLRGEISREEMLDLGE